MICLPGKCLKCALQFSSPDGRASHLYTEVSLSMDNGGELRLGLCERCELKPEEFQDAIDAINKVLVAQGSHPVEGKAVGIKHVKSYAQIIKESQGGLCAVCHKEIADTWIITNNEMRHEMCTPKGL